MKTSHDVSGHLGLSKTYDQILWPRQLTGKPNQMLRPVPLQPIPVTGQPFEHLIIYCVGPLPHSKAGSTYMLTVMCQTTRHPAAYPIRNITSKSVVKACHSSSQFLEHLR